MSKYYVAADAIDREKILKALKSVSQSEAVNDPAKAQFFIEFRTLSRNSVGRCSWRPVKWMSNVMRDWKKVVAWSAGATDGAFKAAVAGRLAAQFKKAIKTEKHPLRTKSPSDEIR